MIPNYSFDQSIAAVTDLVMERATERAAEVRAAAAAAVPTEHRTEGIPT